MKIESSSLRLRSQERQQQLISPSRLLTIQDGNHGLTVMAELLSTGFGIP